MPSALIFYLQPAKSTKAKVRKKEESMARPIKMFVSQSPPELNMIGHIEECQPSVKHQRDEEIKRKKKEKKKKRKKKEVKSCTHRGILDSKKSDSPNGNGIASPSFSENDPPVNESDSSKVKLKPSHYPTSSNNSLSGAVSASFQSGRPPEDDSQERKPRSLQELASCTLPHHVRPPDHTPVLYFLSPGQAGGLSVTSNPPHYTLPPEHLLPSAYPHSSRPSCSWSCSNPPHLHRPPEQSSAHPNAPEKNDSGAKVDEDKDAGLFKPQDDEGKRFNSTPIQDTGPPESQSVNS